ncbi:response regulator 10 [Striga asiatica]|uniref:Response regulator 10 n=1 Tax=Striga asiatica TaxID=4170 RepID=A0A5A7QFY8_STRAF|nr:response regulator 10 [Striga asiatica]
MSQQNSNPVIPAPFRGLRVLLVDKETTSLLSMATELELYSYRVTTTELTTVALSILRDRKDSFDLIMADTNMPEKDCFNFIKCVRRIKDFPIILMSSELNKDMVKEAMTKGACFCLEKPISSKNLKNVWQHVCRMVAQQKNMVKTGTNSNNPEQANSKGDKVLENDSNAPNIVDQTTLQEYGSQKLTGMRKKRSALSRENDEPRDLKRARTENECGEHASAKPNNLQKLKSLSVNVREIEDKGDEVLKKHGHLKLKGVIDAKGKRSRNIRIQVDHEDNPGDLI